MSNRVAVTLRINVPGAWQHGTRVQVFCDFGTGTIDLGQPLLARPIDPYARTVRPRGHGSVAHGSVPHGAATAELGGGGHGYHAHGSVAHGAAVSSFVVTVQVPDACGLWKFAAQAIDEAGNAQGDALTEWQAYVSGRQPRPVGGFALVGYDQPSDTLTFSYV